MTSSSNEKTSPSNEDSLELFQKLLLSYVRQVSRQFPSDKSIHTAVKTLEKSITKPRKQ
ncbi:hypothetical protein SAMN05216167_12462 [Spirosoma endophyticum]|uniref:Uncharacterized protein n=1 Tax=Spirosoma endophyticum TaxID=662367 RepID=A0A1I2F6B1_9BACT|nr:hypothetical protein SAMN05216167_12462 [Spirosoma endophyticum]